MKLREIHDYYNHNTPNLLQPFVDLFTIKNWRNSVAKDQRFAHSKCSLRLNLGPLKWSLISSKVEQSNARIFWNLNRSTIIYRNDVKETQNLTFGVEKNWFFLTKPSKKPHRTKSPPYIKLDQQKTTYNKKFCWSQWPTKLLGLFFFLAVLALDMTHVGTLWCKIRDPTRMLLLYLFPIQLLGSGITCFIFSVLQVFG